MGDSRRFDLFAKLTDKHIYRETAIVDVASGKGYLQAALRQRGFSNITSWDKRKKNGKNRKGHRYGWFNWKCKEEYGAVLAMHPDEATDHAILYAGKHKVPALVCPCCVKSDAVVFWGKHTFKEWVKHLKRLADNNGLSVQEEYLPMVGKNLVLILKSR